MNQVVKIIIVSETIGYPEQLLANQESPQCLGFNSSALVAANRSCGAQRRRVHRYKVMKRKN